MVRLMIATRNAGKQREYEQLLGTPAIGIALCWPQEMGLALDVAENGATYMENARLKALAHAQAAGLWSLADDSGLEVDALSGKPGVHSARYGGSGASDADRYRLLLHRLEGVPWVERRARFRCVVVLAAPSGETYAAEGVCEGMIAQEPKGQHGFGYDPVFYLPDHGRTMAELSPGVKNRVSHRGRAVGAMLPTLNQVLREPSAGGQAWEP
jgi:XTP/dITP diphosphohydrolase